MIRFTLLTSLLCLAFSATKGQDSASISDLKIGEWAQHLPWQRAKWVTQNPEKVFFATEWAILELQKSDRSPRFLTTVDGLSETGLGPIRFDAATQKLVITYSNSNIDLRDAMGSVTNLPFISNNPNIVGDKRVFDIFLHEKAAYLSCAFGLSKLDLEAEEFDFTVFTGQNAVRGCAFWQNQLWMATDQGIFRAPFSGQNLADFTTWKKLGPADGFPQNYTSSAVAVFDNQLYFDLSGDLFNIQTLGDAPFLVEDIDPNLYLKYLTTEGAGLVAGFACRNTNDCSTGGRVFYLKKDGSNGLLQSCVARPAYSIEGENGQIWHADDYDKFRILKTDGSGCDEFVLNSPFTERCQDFAFGSGGEVYAAAGTYTSALQFGYNRDGFYRFKNGEWKQFSNASQPLMNVYEHGQDWWRMLFDEENNRLWVGSIFGGLIEMDAQTQQIVEIFDKENSTLGGAIGDPNRTEVAGLAFDSERNLWISNYKAARSISVFKKDGTQRSLIPPGIVGGENLHLVITPDDLKFLAIGTSQGILAWDTGADIDAPADDKFRVLTTSNSVLPSNRVNALAVDLDGDVWVGTDKGMCGFQCGQNVLDASCKGSRPPVEVEGFLALLLENKDVRSIAIDGANRKWVGTTTGIFVLSPDCGEVVGRFTEKNSPLFSDVVQQIRIHPKNGDIWLATDKGIQSLRGEANFGKKLHATTAYAFPNPVAPTYDGPIAITGLARDSNVKITDAQGFLVFETTSLGGQAIWDGRDYLGNRAASGVYMVWATGTQSFDQPEAEMVAKIVVVR